AHGQRHHALAGTQFGLPVDAKLLASGQAGRQGKLHQRARVGGGALEGGAAGRGQALAVAEGDSGRAQAGRHAGKEALAHGQHGVADAVEVAAVAARVLAGAAVHVHGAFQAGAVGGGHQ
nr:hypothetical protein [Tanacetum cinerariifolium]